jgi:3',5'-nucleoside bisphosphate phosphatase
VRTKRAEAIVEKLRRMGFRISISDFNGRKEKAAIGRPHIADKLKEMGIVFSRQEAFDKFLARGKPAYVFYEGPSPKEAIDMICECKGIPVLAHPGFLVQKETIDALVKLGLQGLETYYPSHSKDQIRNFIEIAQHHNLVTTGGSDYHGPGSGHERLGEIDVPLQTIEALLQRKQKLFG